MSKVGKWLVSGSYGLFLILLVCAAAAYGLTRAAESEAFICALGVTFALWVAGHLCERRLPHTGRWIWVLVAALLSFGWFITGLGIIYEGIVDGNLASWEGWISNDLMVNWGTYDAEISTDAMWRTTALLGGMLMAIDFWSVPARARGLVLTMILSSFGMVLLFFLQKIAGAPFILMSEDGRAALSFVTYRYHGNAAAYLNLLWPITAAVAIFAAVRQSTAWPIWCLPLAAMLLATFLNVSKAGNVLAPVGVLLLLLILIPFFSREIKRSRHRIRRSRLLVALLPVLVIAASIPFALPWERWDVYARTAGNPGGRLEAYSQFVKMIPEAGAGGLGPGTFMVNSIRYTRGNPLIGKFWYNFAHEDYLQTLIEWGYIGTFLWVLLLVPPSTFLLLKAYRSSERPPHEFEGYRMGVFDHIKGFFETIPSPKEPCLAAGAFTAILLTAIHSTMDFPMQIPSLQFYFLTLLALGWSYGRKEQQLPKATPPVASP